MTEATTLLLRRAERECLKQLAAPFGLILDDHLTVDHRRSASQPRRGRDDRCVATGPVVAIASEGVDLTAVNHEQRAIAVMLDLVELFIARRRLGHERV